LADKKKSQLGDIEKRLQEVSQYRKIEHIDLYGGEIGILPVSYLLKLDQILRKYTNSINIITNLRFINPYFLRNDISVSVSYDFEFRQDHQIVFNNISKLNKRVSILTLAIPEICTKNALMMIQELNKLPNIESWELKKYSPNQVNQLRTSYTDYENLIISCLENKDEMKFQFMNDSLLKNSLNKSYSAYSDSHIYITPNSKFGILDFDQNNNEQFIELESFEDYLKWTLIEKQRVSNNTYCSQCKYLGHCFTEHLRNVSMDPEVYSCDGQFKLLKYLENTRYKD